MLNSLSSLEQGMISHTYCKRIVPIPYEADNSTLESLFLSINGLFVPGGSATFKGPTKLAQSVSYLLHRALEVNDNNDFFPVMAECLGHEILHYILSGYKNVFVICRIARIS
jgi:gamma-glutamyl hydrolase